MTIPQQPVSQMLENSADLTMREMLDRAVEAYKAMDPVDRALHDDEQRRSFVRGQSGHDPGQSVLAQEVRRLRAVVAHHDQQAASAAANKKDGQ